MLALLGGIMALGAGFLTFTVTPAGPLAVGANASLSFTATWTLDDEIPGSVQQLQFIREKDGTESVIWMLPGPLSSHTATRSITFPTLGDYTVYARIYPAQGMTFDSENVVEVDCTRADEIELTSRTKTIGLRSLTGVVELTPRTGNIALPSRAADVAIPVN